MKNSSIGAIVIALSVIVTAIILGNAWKSTHNMGETIEVTGLSKKDFTSDLIVWSGNYTRKAMEMKEAYAQLKCDAEVIKKYLISKGVKEKEIVFSSVGIDKQFKYVSKGYGMESSQIFDGYQLSQSVEIESHEVDKIELVSREVTELINSGVEFYSTPPSYYYTKLAELKIEMLASATKDARVRAEKIAENSGSKIGDLKNANMGIFQITAQNSSEDFTWGGAFNTSSKRKTAAITVKLEFSVN